MLDHRVWSIMVWDIWEYLLQASLIEKWFYYQLSTLAFHLECGWSYNLKRMMAKWLFAVLHSTRYFLRYWQFHRYLHQSLKFHYQLVKLLLRWWLLPKMEFSPQFCNCRNSQKPRNTMKTVTHRWRKYKSDKMELKILTFSSFPLNPPRMMWVEHIKIEISVQEIWLFGKHLYGFRGVSRYRPYVKSLNKLELSGSSFFEPLC